MKTILSILLIHTMILSNVQDKIKMTGMQYFALAVDSADATSKWYEHVFQMKLLKQIGKPDAAVYIRIIGNKNLQVEILQNKHLKLEDDSSELHSPIYKSPGYFKIGFYVKNLLEVKEYFQKENIMTFPVFDDPYLKVKSFMLIDINGNLLQILEKKR